MRIHALVAIVFVSSLQAAVAGGASVQASGSSSLSLGRVTISQPVLANGAPLAPGTYDVRLTGESLAPLPGQTTEAERVVEFVADGHVVAREVATVYVPEGGAVGTSGDARVTGAPRVELLKGGEFLRVSLTRNGTRYLIHLPTRN